jgi:hypothetical protein
MLNLLNFAVRLKTIPSVWALLVLTSTLLFVYTLPHAMALRKLLLFTAFLLSAKACVYAFR